MKRSEEQVEEMLRVDPFRDAETITGKNYKEDKDTDKLGMELFFRANEAKDHVLESNADTYYNIPWSFFVERVLDLGFELVHEEPCSYKNNENEIFQVYYRKPGQVLICASYGDQETVNSCSVYYNWRPDNRSKCYEFTSGGGYYFVDPADEEKCRELGKGHDCRSKEPNPADVFWNKLFDEGKVVWSGDHDGREALVHNMARLEKNGHFIEPWPCPPLIHAVVPDKDTEKPDYAALTMELLRKLPQRVQDVMNLEHERYERH